MKYSVVYLALYFCHCLIPDADPSVCLLPLSSKCIEVARDVHLLDGVVHGAVVGVHMLNSLETLLLRLDDWGLNRGIHLVGYGSSRV